MARTTDYNAKIAEIEAKIVKRKEDIKGLKEQLADLQEKKNKEAMSELTAYMQENGLTAAEVLELIRD